MDKDEMMKLRLSGLTYQEIAEKAETSRQYVQQRLAPWKRVQTKIRRLADGRCAGCAKRVGVSGQIHHKRVIGIRLEDYNEPRNLALLCRSCHSAAHNERRYE